jgi:hypothetical protein
MIEALHPAGLRAGWRAWAAGTTNIRSRRVQPAGAGPTCTFCCARGGASPRSKRTTRLPSPSVTTTCPLLLMATPCGFSSCPAGCCRRRALHSASSGALLPPLLPLQPGASACSAAVSLLLATVETIPTGEIMRTLRRGRASRGAGRGACAPAPAPHSACCAAPPAHGRPPLWPLAPAGLRSRPSSSAPFPQGRGRGLQGRTPPRRLTDASPCLPPARCCRRPPPAPGGGAASPWCPARLCGSAPRDTGSV